jgi:hypothetical protein
MAPEQSAPTPTPPASSQKGTSKNATKVTSRSSSDAASVLVYEEGIKQMKLEINVPISGLDLASLLEGEQGLFLCQNRGQNYITVAKAGHSIAFGPTPIGKAIQEQPTAALGPEPWFVTKISNSTEFAEFRVIPGREMR